MIASSPKDAEADACSYMLTQAQTLAEKVERHSLWILLAAFLLALASVAINLGIIDITGFKYGDAKLNSARLGTLKFFLAFASFAAAVVFYYMNSFQRKSELIVEYLSTERNYDKAAIICDFEKWYAANRKSDYYQLVISGVLLVIFGFVLLIVLPFGTLIYSLLRSPVVSG
jgi:hypothetical protein